MRARGYFSLVTLLRFAVFLCSTAKVEGVGSRLTIRPDSPTRRENKEREITKVCTNIEDNVARAHGAQCHAGDIHRKGRTRRAAGKIISGSTTVMAPPKNNSASRSVAPAGVLFHQKNQFFRIKSTKGRHGGGLLPSCLGYIFLRIAIRHGWPFEQRTSRLVSASLQASGLPYGLRGSTYARRGQ